MSNQKAEQVAKGLAKFLADTYTLYLKTHNYHWNVTGSQFIQLHQLFEQEYMDLQIAVDVIAERIRALGYPAPGSYKAFANLTSIEEEIGSPDAKTMVNNLINDQNAVIKTARELIPLTEEIPDEASADLLTQRIQIHEKNAWMLRSLVE